MVIDTNTTQATDRTDNDGFHLFALLFALSFLSSLVAAEALNRTTNLGDLLLGFGFLTTMAVQTLTLFPVLEKKTVLMWAQIAWIAAPLALTAVLSV